MGFINQQTSLGGPINPGDFRVPPRSWAEATADHLDGLVRLELAEVPRPCVAPVFSSHVTKISDPPMTTKKPQFTP